MSAGTTLSSRLHEHARLRASAPFCTFLKGGSVTNITFGELFDRSASYAQAYRELGVVSGDIVIVILQHTPDLFYSYLGAILAGAIPSFMPFPSPKQRTDMYWREHDALFKRIEPRLLVTYEQNLDAAREALPDFSIPSIVAEEAILGRRAARAMPGMQADPGSVACLQHSSGTTGLKKGVMLTHRAILDEVKVYAQRLGFSDRDSIASWLPLYHDMGFIGCFMTSVLLGTRLVALDPFEWVMRPAQLLDVIEQYRTTFTWLPNFAFTHIVNGARRDKTWDLSCVRAFINCSEPCKAATFERFLERFESSGVRSEQLQICYAMAENVFAVTQTPLGRPVNVHDRWVSCGTPVDGVEIEIRSPGGMAVAEGDVGEICLRSPFMFDGYYKLPETTRERVRDGWYYTRDMGFLHAGELYVTGRIDDMLIVNGRNYYAHEIEAIVNSVGGAIPGRNVAIGVNDERTDATVVVVLAECRAGLDDSALAVEIKRRVLESLGLAIHSVVILSSGEMVKTTSGKISRSKNNELYSAGLLSPRSASLGR